jgi:pimeloyl-ACP methyl ester carboxylesterase
MYLHRITGTAPTSLKTLNPKKEPSDILMVFYHGKDGDIGSSSERFVTIWRNLKVNVLLVEYPSYGTYTDTKGTNTQLLSDSLAVYLYLTHVAKVPVENLILIGNSMGCAVVNHMAAALPENLYINCGKTKREDPSKLKCVINIAPFRNVKEVTKQSGGFVSWFVDEYFFFNQ